ncbi:MAG: 16S rRNA (cytosine(967)-C(5))-methyltransferase RsmB [Syntrophobacteraceae bacterium]|jgi:16S rRNA (cytosine967-C5)-methyltransferase|nr:16S rRNA (cytosine(967)-C(5))-methyltransferase RsmB [Syntrophobacteraceae bacterium]
MITARLLAYQILLHLDQKPSQPDRLIRTLMGRHSGLDARDRALLTELVYGTLRWQGRLDWHIAQLSRVPGGKIQPGIRILLRMGIYQLLFLERVPAHAAIDEAVKMTKCLHRAHLAGFVNGILREAARRENRWDWPSPEDDPVEHLAVTTSHPPWFVGRMTRELGLEGARMFCEANNGVAPLTIRVNRAKAEPAQVMDWLKAHGVHAEPSPYLEDAVRLRGIRSDLSRLAIHVEGWAQAQDEASQLIGNLVSPRGGERILDLCAGFGGKTTHIAALMKNHGEIVAVDASAWKLEELQRNAARQGITGITTAPGDLMHLDPGRIGLFHRVLLDAPCTGFGTLRRNPDIKWRRHPKDPYRFSQIQRQYLEKAADLVREGGVLVYATCSVFREENEDVADAFTEAHPGWTPERAEDFLPNTCRSMTDRGFFRSWPHLHGVDGFFGARWRKERSS